MYVIKMKSKKKHTIVAEQFQNSKREKKEKETNNRSHSWLDTGASIKSGRIKLVLYAQINLFYKFNLEL